MVLQFSTASSTKVPDGAPAEGGEKEGEAVPDDITTFYDKIDKEEEDEDEASLKTVSFEVNQVSLPGAPAESTIGNLNTWIHCVLPMRGSVGALQFPSSRSWISFAEWSRIIAQGKINPRNKRN